MIGKVALLTSCVASAFAAFDYCEPPKFRDLGIPVANAEMDQVIVLFRHGDRAPSYPVPNYTEKANFHCIPRLYGQSAGLLNVMSSFEGQPVGGNCQLGQLTAKGTHMFGDYVPALRDYLRKIEFIDERPPGPVNPSNSPLVLHSSPIERTQASLSSFLSHLYPDNDRNVADAAIAAGSSRAARLSATVSRFPPVQVTDALTSPLTFPFFCPTSYDALVSAALINDPNTAQWYNTTTSRFVAAYERGLNVDAKTARDLLSRTQDAFGAMRCNSQPLPAFFSDEMLQSVCGYAASSISTAMLTPTFRPYFASPILNMIFDILGVTTDEDGQRNDRDPSANRGPRVTLLSAHDITLLQLITAVTKKPTGVWPPYASSVRIEIYKAPNRLRYISIIFNEERVPLPCRLRKNAVRNVADAVADEGNTLCEVNNFLDMVEEFANPLPSACPIVFPTEALAHAELPTFRKVR